MSATFNPSNTFDNLAPAETDSPTPTPSTIIPSPTGYGGNPSDNDEGDGLTAAASDDRDHGVLNYYFLLLAVLIIFILIVWFAILRRRRKKALQFHSVRQRALAQDVQGWGGRYRFGPAGRWRMPGTREPRPEEGLDERGEAPPPYMPNEPQAAHTRRDVDGNEHGIELGTVRREEGKPPEYR